MQATKVPSEYPTLPSKPDLPLFHPVSSQQADNVLLTMLLAPMGLRMSMGGSDHLLSDGSFDHLPFDYAIKKNQEGSSAGPFTQRRI
ncbi:hypothetical protein EVAR_46899_1 [Eumeta japonica]|uniref:Uncharacterized protein n=1 Tax=Eumeta variegata TaxID=151549 RepID=A0A4C1YGJ7_EUMVA|nr:hypothetical protein EVAR_46899_1 [Eumeta japonica]